MQKRTFVLVMAVLLAALLGFAGVAQSAMWAGVELGGNFLGSTTLKAGNGEDTLNAQGNQINPTVIGGVTLGYDFVRTGFGGYDWPDWMKYFSIATDLTYNRLSLKASSSGGNDDPSDSVRLDGYCVTWSFLVMAHYGLLPDTEVPEGRINPYIGVGPAIVFSGLRAAGNQEEPDEVFPDETVVTEEESGGGNTGGNATNVALVVEPGIRWMVLKSVSIDTSFRYRYCQPRWNFGGNNYIKGGLNQFSFLVRTSYHF